VAIDEVGREKLEVSSDLPSRGGQVTISRERIAIKAMPGGRGKAQLVIQRGRPVTGEDFVMNARSARGAVALLAQRIFARPSQAKISPMDRRAGGECQQPRR